MSELVILWILVMLLSWSFTGANSDFVTIDLRHYKEPEQDKGA